MKKIYFAAVLTVFLPMLALAAPLGATVNTNTNSSPSALVAPATPISDPGFVWGFYRPGEISVPYTISFTCTGGTCDGTYAHSMTVDSFNQNTGSFTATGSYIPDPTYTWTANGTTTVNSDATGAITFHAIYTGSNAGYTIDAIGTIANDGTLSGTAVSSAGQTFTWTMDKKAKPIATFADASSCVGFTGFKNMTLIGSGTLKGQHAPDARLDGSIWANDTFNWNLNVYQIGTSTSNQYCGIVRFSGSYVTPTSTEAGPNVNDPTSTITGKTAGDFVGSEIYSFNAASVAPTTNWTDIWNWMGDSFVGVSNMSQNQVWEYGAKSHTQQWIETYTPDQSWMNYGNITNP